MIIKNLTIVQHQNTLRYAIIGNVVINIKSISPNQKIICTYNKQH